MRVKTDDRRRAILQAAGQVFRRAGFDGSSMAAISARLGGSKATLYSYFESKEDLFESVMIGMVDEQVDSFLRILDHPSGDLRAPLLGFGEAYVTWVLSPEVMAVLRGGIETRERDGLGPRLFARGPQRCWERVAVFLARAMEGGVLRPADPLAAAVHLKGLLQAGLFEPYLFGAPGLIPRAGAVALAVEAFLRAYRADGAPTRRRRRAARPGRAAA